MDDGLALIFIASNQNQSTGLNPYCSGRWSRTCSKQGCKVSHHEKVLILIVVDDGLVLSFNSCNTCGISGVLILVVVDDGLVLILSTSSTCSDMLS